MQKPQLCGKEGGSRESSSLPPSEMQVSGFSSADGQCLQRDTLHCWASEGTCRTQGEGHEDREEEGQGPGQADISPGAWTLPLGRQGSLGKSPTERSECVVRRDATFLGCGGKPLAGFQ